jgi:hypothetical protein
MDLRTGTCPLCHTSTVHVVASNALGPATHVPLSAFTAAAVTRYVCTTCGYIQGFIEEPDQRSKVAQKWPHLPPRSDHG